MTEQNIQELLNDVVKMVTPDKVFEKCYARMDIDAIMQHEKNRPLTFQEIGANFAYIGFLEGVEFALRNTQEVETEDN